jgi:hypothetical protein
MVGSEKRAIENDEVGDRQSRAHLTQEVDFSPQGIHDVLPERRSDTRKEKGIS